MDILHEDAEFLVVNKPAGIPVIPGRFEPDSVLRELGRQLAKRDKTPGPKLLVVHRLDQDTSGVLVLARTTDAQSRLSSQFSDRNIEKTYHALVRGLPEPAEGDIDAAVGADPERPGSMKVWTGRGGKAAHSHYRVLEEFRGVSLVEVRPTTGRTHQIRVHMASIGHPVAVDPLYGPRIPGGKPAEGLFLSEFKAGFRMGKGQHERPLIGRLTLHALRLKFARPGDGRMMEIEAPLPKDFRATLEALRKWAPPRRRATDPAAAAEAGR
jgi:RluA family pseudouridine synthase